MRRYVKIRIDHDLRVRRTWCLPDTVKEAINAGQEEWLQPERIIECHHGRGRDELVHRALKDFAAQELPFQRFGPNAAFYYTILTAFFLYEAFKQDVTDPVVPVPSYPTRLRRVLIDTAAKIVRHAGRTILKVTRATWGLRSPA